MQNNAVDQGNTYGIELRVTTATETIRNTESPAGH
jgi:hypothetical protein